jgi:hypothetical protein
MDNEFNALQKYVECFVGMWDEDIGIGRVIPLQDGIIIESGYARDVIKNIENQVKAIRVIKNVDINVRYKDDNTTITILFDSAIKEVVCSVIKTNIEILKTDGLNPFIQKCSDDFGDMSSELSFADDSYDTDIDWEISFYSVFRRTLLDILVNAKAITNKDRAKYN